METSDSEIRFAAHKKLLKDHHTCPNTFVIEELGIAHGKQRIDIAVLNGSLHGYEIKSSKDTLARLPSQVDEYTKCFEKLSFIVAPNHYNDVLAIAPAWSEIVVAEKGPRGAVHFSQLRKGIKNPNIKVSSMLMLLWKSEARDFLTHLGFLGNISRKSRLDLYDEISKMTNPEEALNWIKMSFMTRKDWRAGQLLSPYGD